MAVKCPYGEARGVAVYCRASGKMVNPLVMPCRSPAYTRCRFYQQAQARASEAKAHKKPEEAKAAVQAQEPVEWSMEESRLLSDPIEMGRIIVSSRSVNLGKVTLSSIRELVELLRRRVGSEGCYVVVLTSGGRELIVKVCGGKAMGASSGGSALSRAEAESILSSMGDALAIVYLPSG